MPRQYVGNEPVYQQLLESYGTDVITGAYMGGQLVSKVFFESCFLETETEHYVAYSSSSSIFGIAGDSGGGRYGVAYRDNARDTQKGTC